MVVLILAWLLFCAMPCGTLCRHRSSAWISAALAARKMASSSPIPCVACHAPSLTFHCTVQRAVDNLYTKLAVTYWQKTQVPGELESLFGSAHRRSLDGTAVVTLNEVPVAPSKQLALLQILAVATLKQGAQPGSVLLSAAAATQEDSDWLEDRDTEMC